MATSNIFKIVDNMDELELKKLKKELKEGKLAKLIENKLTIVSDENKVCPTCHKPVSNSDYVLTFGPSDLRMKASFDGLDCLKNFLNDMK